MKRLSMLAIALIATMSIIISCKKNESYCTFMAPRMVLVKFSENESDTIVLRRYEKGNSFSKMVDTILLSKAEINYKTIGQDSVAITSTNPLFKEFSENLFANDWEIYVPGAQVTERISEVKGRFDTKSKETEPCQSFVESMKYQGSVRNYNTWLSDDYSFYLLNKK